MKDKSEQTCKVIFKSYNYTNWIFTVTYFVEDILTVSINHDWVVVCLMEDGEFFEKTIFFINYW